MSKLTWIACNGVKPDLPKGAKVRVLWRAVTGSVVDTNTFYARNEWVWEQSIAYALAPVDPVKELVEAANILSEQERKAGIPMSHWFRLRAAIKAVEDMGDE